ncbi:MAG: D-aminoacyl-tRNA deacylase [Thermoanaerobaculum sp.]|nr:D-aminoacyl-tRNA deacylase [Thermoanaerobaculum sp.]MDW7968466.1 D-aminoacyl-tRNA deacylase [Thermoanaerobaculum sp.]
MKAVLQRVAWARVKVEGEVRASIGRGLLILVAIERGDTLEAVEKAAERFATLRVFEDAEGKMNVGLTEAGGSVLLVSQFTLAGSIAKGRRPSFDGAAPPEVARPLFEALVDALGKRGVVVATGVFGARMEVELLNDGPVTFIWQYPQPKGPAQGADI